MHVKLAVQKHRIYWSMCLVYSCESVCKWPICQSKSSSWQQHYYAVLSWPGNPRKPLNLNWGIFNTCVTHNTILRQSNSQNMINGQTTREYLNYQTQMKEIVQFGIICKSAQIICLISGINTYRCCLAVWNNRDQLALALSLL